MAASAVSFKRLGGEEPGDTLAVPASIAECNLGGFGALEVELQIVLPRHADAAVQMPVPATLRYMSEAAALAIDTASGASSSPWSTAQAA